MKIVSKFENKSKFERNII